MFSTLDFSNLLHLHVVEVLIEEEGITDTPFSEFFN